MEIKISTRQVLKVLYVLAWIIFIGLCIEAGGIIFNAIFVLAVNADGAKQFWEQINLSALYRHDPGSFLVQTTLMSIVAVLRAVIFYLIVKLLYDKQLNLQQPFNHAVGRFIFHTAYLALGTGLFSLWGAGYAGWLVRQGVDMPGIQYLRLAGGDVWLFMGVVLFIIAQIFKKGIDLQTENDLTI